MSHVRFAFLPPLLDDLAELTTKLDEFEDDADGAEDCFFWFFLVFFVVLSADISS